MPSQLTPPLSAEAPPTKMPRMEDSAMQRKQSHHSLELLCRLYPEQKRSVLELILKGCNYDLVQAIECILPSHERAIQQLSTMPSQSFSLANSKQTPSEPSIRTFSQMPPHHGNENSKHQVNSSAFVPFPGAVAPHSYGAPCDCADCIKHPGSKSLHISPRSPKAHMTHMLASKPPQPSHRMVPYVPVSSHTPHAEPVKICAGCGGKMKLEDHRCPTCEPEAKP
ncbi:doublesex- and mab-3-related transcription factor A2-like [Clytia hemisphaerica]